MDISQVPFRSNPPTNDIPLRLEALENQLNTAGHFPGGYLPTWMVDVYGLHVGKYTICFRFGGFTLLLHGICGLKGSTGESLQSEHQNGFYLAHLASRISIILFMVQNSRLVLFSIHCWSNSIHHVSYIISNNMFISHCSLFDSSLVILISVMIMIIIISTENPSRLFRNSVAVPS